MFKTIKITLKLKLILGLITENYCKLTNHCIKIQCLLCHHKQKITLQCRCAWPHTQNNSPAPSDTTNLRQCVSIHVQRLEAVVAVVVAVAVPAAEPGTPAALFRLTVVSLTVCTASPLPLLVCSDCAACRTYGQLCSGEQIQDMRWLTC